MTLVLTIVGLSRGLIEASQTRTRGVGADIIVRPPGAAIMGMSGAPMPEGVVGFIEKQPQVAMAQGVVFHPIGGIESLIGVDIDRFDKMSGGLDYRKGGPFRLRMTCSSMRTLPATQAQHRRQDRTCESHLDCSRRDRSRKTRKIVCRQESPTESYFKHRQNLGSLRKGR